ncbi:hypothetical protein MHYP_G00071700 [Metynnis hypsauchen]
MALSFKFSVKPAKATLAERGVDKMQPVKPKRSSKRLVGVLEVIDKQNQSMHVSWSQYFHLAQVFVDMTKANTLSAIERTMVGIYVARETPGHNSSDVGVILEVLLHNLENMVLD